MGVLYYNCLTEIIEKVRKIGKLHSGAQIIWGGNARNVPLINEALRKDGVWIDCVIDNDPEKQGKEVRAISKATYFDMIVSPEQRRRIYIYNPKDIIDLHKEQIYIIASGYRNKIKAQLLENGIEEDHIITFSIDVQDGLKQQENIREKIAACRPLSLRELQMTELQILKRFHTFCKENGLVYFLSSGSLLGAVRHKGFIPWDDDIDVYMPYEDYRKFVEIYPKGDAYEVVDWTTDEQYFWPFGKMVDTNTLLLHQGYPLQGCLGVYIDIFPLAGYSAGEEPEVYWNRNTILNENWYEYYEVRDIIGNHVPDIRPEIIEEMYQYSYYESDIVGARHIIPHIKQWCTRKNIYANVVSVEFEGELFDAPAGYEELLTVRYGDYMKLPALEDQIGHSPEAFVKTDLW